MNPPFSAEQFLGVFEQYNRAVWPMPLLFYVVALLLVVLAVRPRPGPGRWIGGLLALLWAWMGVVYHWSFFTAINPAAYLFGALFVLQAALFVAAAATRSGLVFRVHRDVPGVVGAVLIGYALVVYPLLGALAGHPFPRGPTLGLPCPTVIFTFGLLLWAAASVPPWLLVIPALWSLLGVSAARSFGIVEDYALPLAAALGVGLIVSSRLRGQRSGRTTRPADGSLAGRRHPVDSATPGRGASNAPPVLPSRSQAMQLGSSRGG